MTEPILQLLLKLPLCEPEVVAELKAQLGRATNTMSSSSLTGGSIQMERLDSRFRGNDKGRGNDSGRITGDYTTNVAMRLFAARRKELAEKGILTPLDLANKIVNAWRSVGMPEKIAKIEVVAPGFINISLQNECLGRKIVGVPATADNKKILTGKKILLEHTSPNPQTTIMLGHLRNNFLGMAMSRLLENFGAKVSKDCIVNDRGTHLCRAILGYLVFAKKGAMPLGELGKFTRRRPFGCAQGYGGQGDIRDEEIKKIIGRVEWRAVLAEWSKKKSGWLTPEDLKLKPDHANLIWYVLGSRAYVMDEKVKVQVAEILAAWEKEEPAVRALWRALLDWSAKGYAETYRRIGSEHDRFWFESDHWEDGKKIVEDGLAQKIFKKGENGAIVTDLAKEGLSDAVVQKADGTALYMTQDLALTRLKIEKFPADLYIWDVASEQNLFFKQLFAVCRKFAWAKGKNFYHLAYGLINFKGGKKMATRKGDVVMADEVLDILREQALEIIKNSNQRLRGKMGKKQLDELAEAVAIGAIKYSLLKYSRDTFMQFDIDESLSLEGDSGPYLQYTHARCCSVLAKALSEAPLSGAKSRGRSVLKNSGLLSSVIPAKAGIQKAVGGLDPLVKPEDDKGADFFDKLSPEELALIRQLDKYEETLVKATFDFDPAVLCRFLYELAGVYNLFYHKQPILKAMEPERGYRLALTAATARVLAHGLGLLGIPTPERM